MKSPNASLLNTQPKYLFALSLFLIAAFSMQLAAKSIFSHRQVSWLKNQDAAEYTSLQWLADSKSLVKVKILPTLNYSGIPMEHREEQADYFNHGKIPANVTQLFADLLNSSHYFFSINEKDNTSVAEYEFQLTIEKYQLPFSYQADDIWWQEINGDVDRWMLTPKPSTIKLTLTMFNSYSKKQVLSKSITTTLSQCDLNAHVQRLTWHNNKDTVLNQFLQTTPGQSFIAASNFLILEAIHLIDPKRKQALVADKFENEIFILAEDTHFEVGQQLDIFQQTPYYRPSQLPIGQVEIVKTFANQAVAYPINFRSDQLAKGDWLDVKNSNPFKAPLVNYLAKNHCSKTPVTDLSW
ncbi:MAG: hypothetical protein Q9M92_16565 [Enterobacterales bacterium]|nr:hypothetical protein [Enterobacterales bacterium]